MRRLDDSEDLVHMMKRLFGPRPRSRPRTPSSRGGERGVTAIEYALIASLIATVIVGSVTALGTQVQRLYQVVAAAFP